MRRIAKLLSIVPVAFVVALSACDSSRDLFAPADVQTQYAKKAAARRVVATVEPGSNEASIGAQGGTIEVRNGGGDLVAKLTIPAGTVKKNTTFTVDVSTDYAIELSATSEHSSVQNDVGSAGFKKGVLLYFNTAFFSESSTGVAELKSNGQLVPVPSTQSGGWLIGELRHFSGYVAITD